MNIIYHQISYIKYLDDFYKNVGKLTEYDRLFYSDTIRFIIREYNELFNFESDNDPLKMEVKELFKNINIII